MKIHFIGIGGIGVSALAQYYLAMGHKVSGSDLVSSEITKALKKKGAKLLIGKHETKNLPNDADLVIYSLAIPQKNPEIQKAKRLRVKIQSYPEALGELTKKYFTIAISGTHGKSTTTALISLILIKAGFNPTVVIGTKLKEFGDSNFRMGKSPKGKPLVSHGARKYLVIEADEWQASFLNYWPKIIVLTNIEREHLDYFKNLNYILKTYKEYILRLPKDGILIVNKDGQNIKKLLTKIYTIYPLSNALLKYPPLFPTVVKNVVYYSLKQKGSKKLKKVLKIPGEHNVSNALAALAVARALKIPDKISFKALSEYRGSWRRFEITKTLYPKPCTLISDYAHHPTEIKVTLKAAREKFPRKKIWVVFQPHQYQRTHYLFDDFVKVFREALKQTEDGPLIDRLVITKIFDVAGREEKKIKRKVSSEKLIKAINKSWAIYIPEVEEVAEYLKKNLKGKEVVIIMGAGNIYKLCDLF
ncbi:UDP-N-acetylmuramate--L-alanine ligase [Patescibacteria group bacterium]|nr:UDP-N-acetylmuramate--L-alanine ligase [Patescibacteria group bacterium]